MLNTLTERFKEVSNPHRAKAMSAYMKNHFEFFGIPSPERKLIQADWFNSFKIKNLDELISLVTQLWNLPQREYHYVAIELLARNKKLWSEDCAVFFEDLLVTHAWWDSVDTLSSQVIGPFFKKFPEVKFQYLELWKNSSIFWLRRVCIIHQLSYKRDTDLDILTEMILLNSDSNEFFIKKAIGWALRQYAKTDPEWVLRFVDLNPLKNLSKTEAVKNIRM